MKKCLYNTYSDKAVGFCWYHYCNITAAQLKRKSCLCKGGSECSCLKKYEDHPYWKQREVWKQRRKERKKMRGF